MIKYPSLLRLLEAIASVFEAYSVALFCRQEDGRYALVSSFSLGDSVRQGCIVEAGQGLVGWIIKNKKPLLVENFDTHNRFLGYYGSDQEAQIKVFAGSPLPGGHGALCMDSKKTYAFTEKDQRLLGLFAKVVVSVLQDIGSTTLSAKDQKLYQFLQVVYALREKHPRWSDFLQCYLELLAGASGYEYAFLVASDEWGDHYFLEGANKPVLPEYVPLDKNFSTDYGLLGWVFKKNQPIFFGDGRSAPSGASLFGSEVKAPGLRTLVALPLKVHGRCRGVLVFGDKGQFVVGDSIRNFASMAAEYLTLFLENLYLKNKLKQLKNASLSVSCSKPQ